MRILLLAGLMFFAYGASAQKDFGQKHLQRLETALVAADSNTLRELLHPDLSYGHSNGWVESRDEVIADLFNGKLRYRQITSTEPVLQVRTGWATVRSNTAIAYTMGGKEGSLSLHVLQVWVRTKKGWQLLARQSTKIN